MTLKSLLLAKALVAFLDSKEVSKQVLTLANNVDKEIDSRFGSESEALQASFVSKVLLPLCSHLMAENQKEYMKMLQIEFGVVRDEYHKDTPEVM